MMDNESEKSPGSSKNVKSMILIIPDKSCRIRGKLMRWLLFCFELIYDLNRIM